MDAYGDCSQVSTECESKFLCKAAFLNQFLAQIGLRKDSLRSLLLPFLIQLRP